jgi:putative cell wall-binding protein
MKYLLNLAMDETETQQQDKTNQYDGIENALDVETEIVPVDKPDIEKKVEEIETSTREQLKKDYEYTRGNLYSLIEKGQEAVDGILELAQESDQPRAFEVAGQLIKHVGDVADKLVDLQKKVAEIENPKKSKEVNTTNNTMFVGSTADLAKFLKSQQDK